MPNPRGNPDFGVKYRFDYGRDQPLTEQVKAVVSPCVKEELLKLASARNCTVPDLIREALNTYLANQKIENISA